MNKYYPNEKNEKMKIYVFRHQYSLFIWKRTSLSLEQSKVKNKVK